MNSFLYTVLDSLIAKGWDGLRNYTLVFPMQRASLYAKQYLRERMTATKQNRAVVLPRMLTIDQLVDDMSDLRLVDEINAVCQLYSVYKNLPKSGEMLSLDAFYGWGRQLVNDFSNIDMSLYDMNLFLENMAAANFLDQNLLDEQQRADLINLIKIGQHNKTVELFFKELWMSLPELYNNFSAKLSGGKVDSPIKDALPKCKLGTKGACYRWVIEHFEEILPRFEGRTFVFVGFNYLLPAERRLMELLKEHNQALFYWDFDPSFSLDKNVYKFIVDNIDHFGNEMPEDVSKSAAPKSITAIATSSAHAQAQYVNQWLTEHTNGRRAIVITDEKMLESVIQALPQSCSGKVNITKGYPLSSTSIYSEVINYLQKDTKHDKQAGERNYVGVLTRLSEFLKCPHLVDDEQTANWYELVQQEAYCQTQLVISRLINLIQEGVLDEVDELRTLRNLLRRCMDHVTLPFHGEPIEDIQIIGVLETRLLDFDSVLILNVEEGVVPGASRDNSFIPFDLRKEHKMPTYEEDSIVYAYNFFRLLRRADDVTLLFSEATADSSKKTMSRFLMQMIINDRYLVKKQTLVESSKTSSIADLLPNQTWLSKAKERSHKPEYLQKPVEGKVLLLSPSALGSYIECPRQFYLRSILCVSEPDQQELILERNDHGSIFHGAVEAAYKKISEGKPFRLIKKADILAFLDDKIRQNNIDEALKASYEEFIQHYNEHHDEKVGAKLYVLEDHPSENEVVRQMLYNTLCNDAELLGDFLLCRQEVELRRCIRFDEYDVSVLLGGFIDRLDVIKEGDKQYLRILDYKTGSFNQAKISADNLEVLFQNHDKQYLLQTLIYSSVCHECGALLDQQYKDADNHLNKSDSIMSIAALPIMPQLMYTQKLSADRHVTINKLPITDYARQTITPKEGTGTAQLLSERFEELLRAKISEILADTTFEKCDEHVCGKSFCAFHALCGRKKSKW